MSEREQNVIRFDQVEIDQSGRRLLVAGVDVPLEPKAFGVLCLLARNPGHAFTRDEILDAVWGHRHVTPGVLNRAVTLIRQALGESAESTRYLHTLHGIGYRLDADLQAGSARHENASNGAPDSSVAAIEESKVDLLSARSVSEMPKSASVAPDRKKTFGLGRATWFVVIGVLALAASLGALLLVRRAQTPSSTTAGSPTLVVLPLRSLGSATPQDALADGLSEELVTRLAQIKGLRLISRTSAARAQEVKLDLDQLGERLHVTHALEGSLRQSDDQLRIDLRLIEIPGGRMLWAQNYDRKLADVFVIEREIAQSVAQALTLKLVSTNSPDIGDPQWFREYLELRHMMWDPKYLSTHAELVEKIRALVARAPTYAQAHGLLARALTQDLRPVEISEGERAESASEAKRALEIDSNQTDAHAALGSVACRVQDWQHCMDEYERALSLDPTDSVLRATYATWRAALGYVQEASMQIEIGLASDPLNFESSVLRGWLVDLLGGHDEARRWLDATAPSPNTLRWFNAVWRRDYAAARAIAENGMAKNDGYRDSYVAASEALIDPVQWPQVKSRTDGALTRLLQPDADTSVSMRLAEEAWLQRRTPLSLLLWSSEWSALHKSPEFQDFLERRHIIDFWRNSSWPPQCKAEAGSAHCY